MPTPRRRHLALAARVTSPVVISRTANKVVVPCRTESWVRLSG